MNFRLITPLLVCCAAIAAADETPAPVERFQQALALEEREGQVKAALKIYLELVKAPATPKGLQVRAELRVALCRERLGQLDEARQAYDALAARAQTWGQVAKAARDGLSRLDDMALAQEKLPQGWLTKNPGRETYDLAVKDANIRTLFLELARVAKLNLVLSPQVVGEVTTALKGISIRPVIEALVKTVGDYSLIEVDGILRIITRSSLERQLVTRAYRLTSNQALKAKLESATTREAVDQASRALLKHRERQADLSRVVVELVNTSSIPSTAAAFDPASETIFVRSSFAGHESVSKALKGEFTSTPRRTSAGPASPRSPLVSAHFEDARASVVLLELAKAAGSPLFVGQTARGTTSLVLHEVSFKSALRAIVESTGDYLVVETPAGPSVRTATADQNRGAYRRWPFLGDAAEFWGGAHGSMWGQGEGQLPGHPVWRATSELVANLGQAGASIQFDPGSHALISRLSAGSAADLRQALVQAGYLEPRRPVQLKGGKAMRGVNARLILKYVAEQHKVNVIISPQVWGELDLILPLEGAPVQAVLNQIAMACGDGDFTAEEIGPRLYRVASQASQDRTLTSEVIPVAKEHLSPTDLFVATSQLVATSDVPGSSVLSSKGRDGSWSLVVTLPRRELAEVKALVSSSAPDPQVRQSLAGQTLLVGRQAWRFGPKGSYKYSNGPAWPPQEVGKTSTIAGWTLRLLADGELPRIQIAERAGERRVERTELLPPPK